MRKLVNVAAAAARRWAALLALGGAVLFWLSLGGAQWRPWLQLAVAGLLTACCAQLDYLNAGGAQKSAEDWLAGYLAALHDIAPDVAEHVDATVLDFRSRRPQ